MNLAISTILIFFILLPGILFRRFYYSAEFSREYFKSSISELLVSTLVPSLLIHIIIFKGILSLWYQLDLETLSILLSGNTDASKIYIAFLNIRTGGTDILLYFLLTSVVGALAGGGCKWYVRSKGLDRKYQILRFQNEWHYIISGEILDFPGIPGDSKDINFIYVDVLTSTSEGDIIYSGILVEYVLSKEGGLDRMYLNNARRRYLKDDKRPVEDIPQVYYEMPGQYFVILFKNVINLHFTYYQLDIEQELDDEIKQKYVK